ncbi:pleckstrin homology domain-containing family G member 5 isoform X2 [Hydra vulgaris]|uniref:pleckstrin homology domain-containing family G member 5 isoform X2 n=1 Tax=Hydra vulgaris TaxID=6087 RepID=UPI001F5FA9E4|nr:pleckstrin homology domain-containing family G member 5 isoform X2 [Hydra vulgaris]
MFLNTLCMASATVQVASRSHSLNISTPSQSCSISKSLQSDLTPPQLPPRRKESPLPSDVGKPPPIPLVHKQKSMPIESHKSPTKIQQKKSKVASSFAERIPLYSALVFDNNNQQPTEQIENYFLENSWSDVISDHFYLTKKSRFQQQALWEFLSTERNYILKLKIIVEVFQQFIKIIQNEGDLLDINENKLFANIRDVLSANEILWSRNLKEVIDKARETKQPIKSTELLASFAQFRNLFKPYIEFSLFQDDALSYLRSLSESNVAKRNETQKAFNEYLEWCENLPRCNRLKLRDLLTEPMQRLTRYPLLLKNIRKESEDEKEKEILDNFISQSETFISDINFKLRKRHEKEKLDQCLQQFDYYNNMKAATEKIKWISIEFLEQNIISLPFEEQRCFLKRGTMKLLEDKKGKKESTVEVLLFTDLVVIAKIKKATNKLHVVKQLFYLDKIKLIKSESQSQTIVFIYLDESGLLATAFLLECLNRDIWINTIERAKVRYQNAKAGEGSTLDFFKDDYSTNNIPLLKIPAESKTNVKYESDLHNLINETGNPKLKNSRSASTPPISFTKKSYDESSRSMSLNGITQEHLVTDKSCLRNCSFNKAMQAKEKQNEAKTDIPLPQQLKKKIGVSPRRSDSGISVRTFNSTQEDSIFDEKVENNFTSLEDHNYESISSYLRNEISQVSKTSENHKNNALEYLTQDGTVDNTSLFHMSNKERSLFFKAPLNESFFYSRSSSKTESSNRNYTQIAQKQDTFFIRTEATQSFYDDVKKEDSYLDNG